VTTKILKSRNIGTQHNWKTRTQITTRKSALSTLPTRATREPEKLTMQPKLPKFLERVMCLSQHCSQRFHFHQDHAHLLDQLTILEDTFILLKHLINLLSTPLLIINLMLKQLLLLPILLRETKSVFGTLFQVIRLRTTCQFLNMLSEVVKCTWKE